MMSGGNILTLQKLLGHSSVDVTMKYAHLAPDFMRDEIGRLRFERPVGDVARNSRPEAGRGIGTSAPASYRLRAEAHGTSILLPC
jgi:hypothetical protein